MDAQSADAGGSADLRPITPRPVAVCAPAGRGEYEDIRLAAVADADEQLSRGAAQRCSVFSFLFRGCARLDPHAGAEVELSPLCAKRLVNARTCQQQQPENIGGVLVVEKAVGLDDGP